MLGPNSVNLTLTLPGATESSGMLSRGDVVVMALLVIGATAVGFIIATLARRPDERAGAAESATPAVEPDRHGRRFVEVEGTDVGFIRADRAGVVTAVSEGLGLLLAGGGPDASSPLLPAPLGRWATAVDSDDLQEFEALLRSGSEPSDSTLQIRVREVAGGPGEVGTPVRGYEVRRLAEEAGSTDFLLVDQSDRVESERRRRAQLRNQRLFAEATHCLDSGEDLIEAIAELLPQLGKELDLRSAAWLERAGADDGEVWEPHATWIGLGVETVGIPERLVLQESGAMDRLHAGVPVQGVGDRPGLILVPVMVKGGPGPLLAIESHRHGLWDEETLDVLTRIGEQLGRRREREIVEAEKESWAATRGALERSEAIAQLTSGVAHDFNGVLFAVLGRFEILRDRIEDPAVIEQLDFIMETIQEAKRLADRLRSALRSGGDPLPINVRPELEEIEETARRLLPKRLQFECRIQLPDSLRPVELVARRSTLQQVLLNLLVNARDAVEPHGRVLLSARLISDDELEVRVDDDGPGIPQGDLERMLEPYETGEHSEGVGLGLVVSRRLAEEAGGRLLLEDSPLGGLAARVVFPVTVAGEAEEDASPDAAEADVERSLGTVVVVEDNPVIRDVLERVIADMGAEVVSRSNAVGLEDALARAGGADLLVFDIDLPERTGVDCLRDLRAAGDSTPCLLITGGLADQPLVESTAFLRKPFRIDDLRREIRALTTRRSSGDVTPR